MVSVLSCAIAIVKKQNGYNFEKLNIYVINTHKKLF